MTVRLALGDSLRLVRRNVRAHYRLGGPAAKFPDNIPLSDRYDFRFMGCGFGRSEEPPTGSMIPALGVIRVVRSGSKRPFTPNDAELLLRLGEECNSIALDWQRQPQHASEFPGLDDDPSQIEAGWRIRGPVHAPQSPETAVRELLQSLITYFKRYDPIHCFFLTEHINPGNKQTYSCYAYRSRYHSVPPDNPSDSPTEAPHEDWPNERLLPSPPDETSLALMFTRGGKSNERAMSSTPWVRSGVRLPVVALDPSGSIIRGILGLDFSSTEPVTAAEVEVVLLATHRLGVIFGPAAKALLPKVPSEQFNEALWELVSIGNRFGIFGDVVLKTTRDPGGLFGRLTLDVPPPHDDEYKPPIGWMPVILQHTEFITRRTGQVARQLSSL